MSNPAHFGSDSIRLMVDATRIGRLAALAERYFEGVSREEYYPSPGMACRWCSFRRQCAACKGGE